MANADVFHHPDGDHTVEATLESAIVEFAEFDQAIDAGGRSSLAGDADLFGGDVDGGDTGAGGGGNVDCEGAPARADLGHGHART